MKFYKIPETKMQDAYPGVLGGNEGLTTKSCCPLRFTIFISRKSEQSYA